MSRTAFNPSAFFREFWARIPDFIWYSDEDLSVRVVFGELIRESRGKDHCWPFTKTIAERLRISDKTVERALTRLEELQLIRIETPEERKSFSQAELAKVKTSGNRYFFECPEWASSHLDDKVAEAWNLKPRKIPQRERAARVRSGSRVGQAADSESVGSDSESVDLDSESVGSDSESVLSLRKLTKEIKEEDLVKFASPSDPQPLRPRRSKAEEGSLPLTPRPELEIKVPPKEELKPQVFTGNQKSTAGALNASQTGFDVAAAVAASQASIRLQRAQHTAQEALEKTMTTRAKKAASKEKKNLERAAYLRDQEPVDEPSKTPLGHLQRFWLQELSVAFPTVALPKKWGGKEMGQTKLLLESYDCDQVEDVFRYVIRNWEALRLRLFKGAGSTVPTVGLILKLHDSLVPEASTWEKYRTVIEEYEAFGGEYVERPEDLTERYLEARRAIEGFRLNKDKR